MGWMWIVWLLIAVAVVWAVVAASRTPRYGGPPRDSAEEILKGRFARGEIDRDEYRRRLEDLRR